MIHALIRAGGRVHRAKGALRGGTNVVEENVSNPTGPYRYFELSRVGLVVGAAEGGVRVETIEAKSPLAAAGLRKGDLVTAVDGKKVGPGDSFRKQMRAAVAQGDCTLTVRRGDETKETAVRFPE